jgi:hypothetical protein
MPTTSTKRDLLSLKYLWNLSGSCILNSLYSCHHRQSSRCMRNIHTLLILEATSMYSLHYEKNVTSLFRFGCIYTLNYLYIPPNLDKFATPFQDGESNTYPNLHTDHYLNIISFKYYMCNYEKMVFFPHPLESKYQMDFVRKSHKSTKRHK